jgi:NADPH-dependent curcumin reductase CurA
MQNIVNRRWFLKQYPEGMPTLDNWTMDEQRVPDPGPGQILVKAKWLSVDPYMRGRMSPATNYTKGVEIGELMQGGALAKSSRPITRSGKQETLPSP